MIVTMYLNRIGHLHIFPGDINIQTYPANATDIQGNPSPVYIQTDVEEFTRQWLTRADMRHLDGGWILTKDIPGFELLFE